MKVRNRGLASMSWLAIALTFSLSSARAEFPETDANGNYIGRPYHSYWQVVDPDPNGLNCRIPRGCSFDDIMGNSCPGFNGNYLDYQLRGTLQTGERFKSFPNNAAGTFSDRRRLPWLFVGQNYDGGLSGCFVRANSSFVKSIAEPNVSQNTAVPMTITFVEEMAGITVPDRDTTRSAYGGELRLYDVHIAKMFEVTKHFCDRGFRGGLQWNYRAGGGNINMGFFQVTCAEANSIANRFGLGESETTPIQFLGEEGYRREETREIPILNIVGSKIPLWLDFVETFSPRR